MTFDGTEVYAGILGTLGARYETSYGTLPSTATNSLGVLKNATFSRKDQYLTQAGIRDSRTATGYHSIRYHYEAETTVELQNPLPFFMALGGYSVTGTDPYTHDITVLRSVVGGTAEYLPSWSLVGRYHRETDLQISLLGATVDSWNLNIDLDGPVTCGLNWIAREEGAASDVATPASTEVYHPFNTTVEIDTANATFTTGTSIEGLNSLSLSGGNGLDVHGDHGTKNIRQPYMGSVKDLYSGSLNRKYIDSDLTGLCDGSVFSLRAKMYRGANDYIYVDVQNCVIEDSQLLGMTDESSIDNTPVSFKFADVKVEGKDTKASYIA